MSIKERREEAEAVLDSAEMLLETFPGSEQKKRELQRKVSDLEQEIQDPESEASLRELINDIRELMDDLKDAPVDDAMDDAMLGPEDEMGPGPGVEDDVPPF